MLGPEPPRLLVLDLETEIDPEALAMLGGGEQRLSERFSLRRIVAAGLLFSRGSASYTLDAVSISTVTGSEIEIIEKVDDELVRLARTGGTLVTYNGKHHDLALLRARAQRHRAFAMRGIQSWYVDRTMPHRDLLVDTSPFDRRRSSSLRDVCAGLGIELRHERARGEATRDVAVLRKVQVDVAATFLVYLHDRCMALGRSEPLESGWPALAAYIRQVGFPPHLQSLASHPYLRALTRRA